MVYGHLFPKASEAERESLRRLGARWKVKRSLPLIFRKLNILIQQYEKDGKWVYEQHPFWCTGYTFWDLHSEAPDLFLHLSRSDLVFFKGDLNHRKLTYDCAAPASTPFDVAIGPMASAAGAPKVCSLRTIKSDVVVGLGDDGDRIAEKLDKDEPGWKISGKYVRDILSCPVNYFLTDTLTRRSFCCPKGVQAKRSASRDNIPRVAIAGNSRARIRSHEMQVTKVLLGSCRSCIVYFFHPSFFIMFPS